MNLRAIARGKSCQVRVPNVCNGDRETTVLAHARICGISGIGLKCPDILAAWACSACHAYCDSNYRDSRLMLLEGTARTLAILVNEGVIVVPDIEHRRPKLNKIVPRRLPHL